MTIMEEHTMEDVQQKSREWTELRGSALEHGYPLKEGIHKLEERHDQVVILGDRL
jgi:hypothetical protein